MKTPHIQVTYFSDILCVWAYIAQRRLEELRERFGKQVSIDCRYISLFGDTQSKIAEGWAERDGFNGYADHVQTVSAGFDHIEIDPKVWRTIRPVSSQGPHCLLKAVQLWQEQQTAEPLGRTSLVEKVAANFRASFFENAQDISDPDIQIQILKDAGLPVPEILNFIKSGHGFAALHRDTILQQEHSITGSPTFVFNQGRQMLYGNVGFKIIEANIKELLRHPDEEFASWC
jgi:predicted DsbA family dithiol-disulfide isomerase